MQPPDSIKKLLEDLQSTDSSLRKTAAEELGRRVPAEQRTIQALHRAAQADTNEAVRSAAAQSFRDLTGAELPKPFSETAATMTEAPTTSSVSRVLRSADIVVLSAILSCVLNTAVMIIIGIFLVVTRSGDIGTILVVTLIINLLVAIYFARRRQFSVVGGIAVGLVCTGFVLWLGLSRIGFLFI